MNYVNSLLPATRRRAYLDTAPDSTGRLDANLRTGVFRVNLRTRRVGDRRSGGSVRMRPVVRFSDFLLLNQDVFFHLFTAEAILPKINN
jgi:hypothetical protein